MNIENLDSDATTLRFTPIELNALGEWDTPRAFSNYFDLSYLFPLGYSAGEVVLQEGRSLVVAVKTARSCQAYDGGGYVISIARERKGGRKVKAESPWGKPIAPKDGVALEIVEPVRLAETVRR